MRDWSEDEVRLTVKDYFDMLEDELAGRRYSKAEHRAELLKQLDDRSKGAVERKHSNISAVLNKDGLRFISGYKPLGNIQHLLRKHVQREIDARGLQASLASGRAFPIQSFSWIVYSDSVAVKTMDKSAFVHHGTGVPADITFFFDHDPSGGSKPVTLVHKSVEYPASVYTDPTGRVRVEWRQDLSRVIARLLPMFYDAFSRDAEPQGPTPEMRFAKASALGSSVYMVSFLAPGQIASDGEYLDEQEEVAARSEGAARQTTTTVYERDPANRLEAIRIHGEKCVVCGFDFGAVYGPWGSGYIEVHHLTPLAERNGEHKVDPRTDLVPVCSNCHRMFHRKKGKVLEVEELCQMIQAAAGLKARTN